MTPDPIEPTAARGTALLRAVAEAMGRVRHALEHGDVPGARHAARHLALHLDALPEDRAAYERLCAEADRELAADPQAWDRPPVEPPGL
jgi:hypothetical protein